jgi:PAS domain S-box-containing protein
MNNLFHSRSGFTADATGDGEWIAQQALGELARTDAPVVFVLDQEANRYLYLDGPCERFFGLSRERMLADVDRWQAGLDPRDREEIAVVRAELAKGGRVQRIFRAQGADGLRRSLRWTAVAQKLLGRTVIAGSVVDLGGAECAGCGANMFRLAAEHAHDGLAVTDAQMRFIFLNREHVEIFGYSSESELLGKTWRELYPEDVVRQIGEVELPKLRADGQWRGRLVAKRKDGTQFHVALSVSLLPSGGLVANCEDISGQVAIEERLKATETMLRVFLNELPTAVTIRNLTGEYEFVNTSMTEFLGKEFKDDSGRRGMEVCLTEHRAFAYWAGVDERVARTGEVVRFDFTINWGGRDWVLGVKKMPLRISSTAITHICTLVNDVTELRRMENEAEEATRRSHAFHVMQREFISMVSHEFRTPLTSIHGVHYLMAKKSEKLPEPHAADFARLLNLQDRAMVTLKELVDQVLLLNRIEHMSTDTVPQPVPVAGFVRRIVETLNVSLANQRIKADIDLPKDYTAALDESQMRAVLENLVSNGLKYSPDTQPVTVVVRTTGEHWSMEVIDRGRGIPKKDQAELFRPFHRASNVGQVPGTGLGLTIVQRVVDFHHGSLAFTSEAGVGTTFTLTFPQKYCANTDQTQASTALPFSKILSPLP